MPVQRRLAAILAADVAGYSRLMGEDEEGTLATLTAHLKELIEPCIAEHRGRVVKTTGDGLQESSWESACSKPSARPPVSSLVSYVSYRSVISPHPCVRFQPGLIQDKGRGRERAAWIHAWPGNAARPCAPMLVPQSFLIRPVSAATKTEVRTHPAMMWNHM